MRSVVHVWVNCVGLAVLALTTRAPTCAEVTLTFWALIRLQSMVDIIYSDGMDQTEDHGISSLHQRHGSFLRMDFEMLRVQNKPFQS